MPTRSPRTALPSHWQGDDASSADLSELFATVNTPPTSSSPDGLLKPRASSPPETGSGYSLFGKRIRKFRTRSSSRGTTGLLRPVLNATPTGPSRPAFPRRLATSPPNGYVDPVRRLYGADVARAFDETVRRQYDEAFMEVLTNGSWATPPPASRERSVRICLSDAAARNSLRNSAYEQICDRARRELRVPGNQILVQSERNEEQQVTYYTFTTTAPPEVDPNAHASTGPDRRGDRIVLERPAGVDARYVWYDELSSESWSDVPEPPTSPSEEVTARGPQGAAPGRPQPNQHEASDPRSPSATPRRGARNSYLSAVRLGPEFDGADFV